MYLSHAGIGEFAKAYDYQKKYLEIRDSTLNSEKQKQINELEAKYENEKKEQQIQVLNRDNKISQLQLIRQKETLTLQEAENEAKQKSILLLEKESSLKEAELEKEKSKSEAERNKAALANQQKAAAEMEAANQRKIVYLFAGGSLLLVFFLFSLYHGYRQKKKANEEILQQKKIIEHQKEIVEERNKEVTDSINYAKRLQEAILPPVPFIKEFLPQSFVYYQPKDIVAGDFFWMEHTHAPHEKGKVFFAVADCTGHGVPGAMVSVVCSNALNRAVKEFGITEPGKILDKVTDLVQATFSRSENQVRDGMDISICAIDFASMKLQWAGANNPLWVIRSKELLEFKPNKQPVGHFENRVPFQTHEMELQREDVLYLFSDGYADQFGGEHLPGGKAGGKKFKESNLKKLLLEIVQEKPETQEQKLAETIQQWMGNLEQLDDICIMGVRVA
jgi:serine phosphatase RsbU (regulator of sigma subunit)